MNENTPTTEEVRNDYLLASEHPRAVANSEFDRWLVATVATAKADALEDAAFSELFGSNARTRLLEMSNEIRGAKQ